MGWLPLGQCLKGIRMRRCNAEFIPINSGGQPATAYSTNFAKIGKLFCSAKDLLAKKHTAHPSVIYEQFPAVVEPPFLLKGVLSLANFFIVVPALMPPSFDTTHSTIFPVFLSLYEVLIGHISASYHPFFWAARALV